VKAPAALPLLGCLLAVVLAMPALAGVLALARAVSP
jgi:hypothetical protein